MIRRQTKEKEALGNSVQDLDVIIRSRLILASSHLVKIDPIPVKDRQVIELFVDSFHK